MTSAEFTDWKVDPRTKEIMKYIEKECHDIAILMSRTAGVNTIQDNVNRGVILGLEKVLNIDYSEGELENA